MSKYIDLIEKLSNRDKKVLELYIGKYGCKIKDFIGLDKWLSNWSHSNQKLYHILGDSLIREFPYEYEKTSEEVKGEIKKLLYISAIKSDYHDFYTHYIKTQDWLDEDSINFFNHLFDVENFYNEKIAFSLKIKKPNAKKILQIQAGTKPIKAIGRVLEYFKEDAYFHMDSFELLKKRYAIILSEKTVKGKFCLSIHPMDFITMSDNASNWSSCMSWSSDGCYHVGTIEMMNSNNVICAYLLNGDTQYVFDNEITDPDTGELIGVWNNKRWRQLFYITKDIVMGGKAYPYRTKELTLAILAKLKELALENNNWTYQFGPELYQDMIHIGSISAMDNQRTWMRMEKKKAFKHNIIWDTNGMYNDMLNDHQTDYWCYRNKVNHTKIISTSGKAPCLCCGKSIIEENCYEDYNDRYDNVGSAICYSCKDDKYRCDFCGDIDMKRKFYIIKESGKKICEHCIKYIRTCPCCGKWFLASANYSTDYHVFNNYIYDDITSGKLPELDNRRYNYLYPSASGYNNSKELIDKELNYAQNPDNIMKTYDNIYMPLEIFYLHSECRSKILDLFENNSKEINFSRFWSSKLDDFKIVDPVIAEPYRYINLKTPNLDDIITPE